MDSFGRFKETSLPPQAAFFNDLTGEPCSDEDYEHAEKVWAVFELKTLKSFCELYCKSDTIQLHCVFEAYRKTALKGYGLDPIHYFTISGKKI